MWVSLSSIHSTEDKGIYDPKNVSGPEPGAPSKIKTPFGRDSAVA